jgi:NAD dependent epimerase/dehydratase
VKIQDRKVLVTGADGFIGSHLVELLVQLGSQVRALVLYNSFGQRGWLDTVDSKTRAKVEIVMGDVRDPFLARAITRDIEVTFHLASLIAIPYSYHAPESYVATNVSGTLNMLQAARDERVQRFVQVSTSEVYGSAQFVPMTELHPLSAQSPYAATKIAADQLALSFHRTFQLPVVVARPFNTFGPRQSTRAIIPTIITQALAGKSITLGATAPRRDFTFVCDTAAAMIAAAEQDAAVGDVVHFGSGTDVSVGELAQKIVSLVGGSAEINSDAARVRPAASEVDRLLCDNSKAAKLLNWKPTVSLESGLRTTIDWIARPENLARYRTGEYSI